MANPDFDLNDFPNDVLSPQYGDEHDAINFDNEDHVDMEPEVGDEEELINEETVDQEGEINPSNYAIFEQRKPHQMLDDNQKKMVYDVLLQKSFNGVLKRNHTNEVANLLNLPLRTIQRIWKQHKDTPSGRHVDISLCKRTTIRSIAAHLDVQPSQVFRLLKEGGIRRHSNPLKPCLKDEHKRARLRFCMSMIDANHYPEEVKFVAMYNYIHIDEKWFFMTKKSESYYLLPVEEDPTRTRQSKNNICKVMFLVAMARPRFGDDGTEIFSGKIGLFPLVNMVPAQRRSINRPAGTIEMKPITSVTREVIRSCLIDKVIPAIRNVWPQENHDEVIYIQQDNARTHVDLYLGYQI